MVTVLHGENQLMSRAQLLKIRELSQKRGVEIVEINGKKLSFDQIQLASQTQSLLGETVVFVEEFWGSRKVTSDKLQAIRFEDLSGSVVFWESRELPFSIVNNFPKSWKVQNFPLSRQTFKFLDSLFPGNSQNALRLLQRVIETDGEYVVLPILAWHVRMLIWAKEDPGSLTGPVWKTRKLVDQAKKFDAQKLFNFHSCLLTIDRNQKTGVLQFPLTQALDLLIIQTLE